MMYSQDLKEYKWQKRVVIVESPTFDNAKAVEQIALLKAESSKFNDFRLVIIEKTNKGKSTDFSGVEKLTFESEIKKFRVLLVGLDGGVKFESREVVPVQKFFSLISAMPMYKRKKG